MNTINLMTELDEVLFVLDMIAEENRPMTDAEYAKIIDYIIGQNGPTCDPQDYDQNESYEDLARGK